MHRDFKCIEVRTNKDIKDFIHFGHWINKHTNKRLEKQLIKSKHILSKYFIIKAYIVKLNNEIVCRAIMTLYNDDTTAYIGFFESKNDSNAVRLLIDTLKSEAKRYGKIELVGPVDSSFWVKYRMKLNNFDYTYTGEPNNPDYYNSLWEKMGFQVKERYHSSLLRVPKHSDINDKYIQRIKKIEADGINIRTTNIIKFNSDFKNIYQLLTKLYSKFPVYKSIRYSEFKKLFWYFRYILDYHMVFVAYKDNKLLGFMVCIPNYNTNSFIKIKLGECQDYVMMYMGADKSAYGLGAAFAEICRDQLEKRNSNCVTALIHDGNISGGFYKELETSRTEYCLYSIKIDSQ